MGVNSGLPKGPVGQPEGTDNQGRCGHWSATVVRVRGAPSPVLLGLS